MTNTLLVVDTETGGLDPSKACIIEIAAQILVIEPGGIELGESFDEKIWPDLPVAPGAAKCNGYTEEAWIGTRRGIHVLDKFNEWIDVQCKEHKRPIWTGCNPIFDVKFYNSDRERFGLPKPSGLSYRVIDVASMAVHLLFSGELENLKLATMRTWAGCEGEQEHTAMGDVIDTCRVIGALLMGRIGNG